MGAEMLNGILQDVANLKGANVLYADTASRFADAHRSMDGVHPKDGYVGRMAQEIKRSLGFHYQKASPKSFIKPKRNDQPQSRYNFSPERQPPRQPPQHQQQPVSVPQKLAAAPVWNNVSQKPTRPAQTPPPDISVPPPPPVAAPLNTCGSQNSAYPGPIPGTINPLHC